MATSGVANSGEYEGRCPDCGERTVEQNDGQDRWGHCASCEASGRSDGSYEAPLNLY